ncbi:MAG: hypothetical protein IJE42_06790 [Bacteroidaceae bacterium]|nr:hypothetical protein [Bacteroidaceae bacterium]
MLHPRGQLLNKGKGDYTARVTGVLVLLTDKRTDRTNCLRLLQVAVRVKQEYR